jgi:hypothetical protein
MSDTGDEAIDPPDDAVEEALTDHHEVAGMVEQAQADKPVPENPFSESPTG